MRSMNLETWVKTITNELVYCDELGLMGLYYMYHRHCVALTQNKLWSTVQADKPLNLLDLLNICSVRLIYLGNLHFGVITWRPCLPKKVATQSPGFNIIEEYTLDNANAALNVDKDNRKPEENTSRAGYVETDTLARKDVQRIECTPNTPIVVKAETGTVLKADTTDSSKLASQGTSTRVIKTSSIEHCKETGIITKPPAHAETVPTQADDSVSRPSNKQLALHVVTTNENASQRPTLDACSKQPNNASQCTTGRNNDIPAKRAVTCPEDSLVLLQYPWKRELSVKLD